MPKQKRHKTKYPGVYYIYGRGLKQGTKEKVYYIHFRKNGKLVEEKAGRQFKDKMTPSRASRIRNQKIKGKLPLNRDKKKSRLIIVLRQSQFERLRKHAYLKLIEEVR